MARKLVFAIAVLSTAACISPRSVYYGIELKEVERPADARVRYGEYRLTPVTDTTGRRFTFEDSLVRISWLPLPDEVSFRLENKTDHSVRILWDDAVFVMPDGRSERVIHSGIRYIERDRSMPPTVVVRRGRMEDFVVPAANIRMSPVAGGWTTDPFLPIGGVNSQNADEELARLRHEYIGKLFSVLLPLQIEGVTNEYLFTFQVNDIELRIPPRQPWM